MKRSFLIIALFAIVFCHAALAQETAPAAGPGNIGSLIGERLTYNVSYANFSNAAYAETYVVSDGKYGVRDAYYLEGKFRTTELVSAAFFEIDEYRKTLIDAQTGLPILYKKIVGENGMARETVTDLKGSATSFDWLSALFELRFTNSVTGSLSVQNGDKNYPVTFRMIGKAHNKTSAGEFDTTVYEVQNSEFVGLQIFLSDDSRRMPVAFSYRIGKQTVRGELASIQNLTPEVVTTATPVPVATPFPLATPKPRPTPAPYVNNEPLSADLPFQLGETLTYRLSKPGAAAPFGSMVVAAKERRQFSGTDSVLLTTEFRDISDSTAPVRAGDAIRSYVDPEALLPLRTEVAFRGGLSQSNQTLSFNQALGKVMDNKGAAIDVPVGTHDILSLAYAVRSFNVKDVKPNKGPGEDIRVSLIYGDTPVILTILSQPEEVIDYQGQKVTAQIVFATIGATTAKLWISKDTARLPLRLALSGGLVSFTADLISVTQNTPPMESTGVSSPASVTNTVNRPLPAAVNPPFPTPPQPGENLTVVNPQPAQPNPSAMPNPTLGPLPATMGPNPTLDPNIKITGPNGPNPTLVNPKPDPNIKKP